MRPKDLISNLIYLICCLAKFAYATDVTLDLNLKDSNDQFDVLKSEHYGLSSLEYYPKEGLTVKKVVQGELDVWKGSDKEYCHNAILYSGSEPLSLLYLNVVVDKHSVYKYFVKVGGKWREVLEKNLEFLVNLDRSAYTPEQLDKYVLEFLEAIPSEVEMVTSFYRSSFSFFIKPSHVCELEIAQPNTIYIMKQFLIGQCFGFIYTPRTDYAISRVTYKGKQLWSKSKNGKLCSSVWKYYRSGFDDLIVIRLEDLNDPSHTITNICFIKNDVEITMTSLENFQKLYNKMSDTEYNQEDIECYKDGYLNARDIAFILNPFFAIFVAIWAVLYSL